MDNSGMNFPEGTRFLVTGAAGFIGSNLCESILSMGYRVTGLDDFSTGRRENIAELSAFDNFDFILGSITDLDTCKKACTGIDYVLHHAAWGSVPQSMEKPLGYHTNNVTGMLNMLEAALSAKVRRFIYASSSAVYGENADPSKTEERRGEVISPYAINKWMNEEYADLYCRLYGLPIIGLRYFNVFGKRQNPYSAYAAVIPVFAKALLGGKSPEIFGDGGQTRDFTYVGDVIRANLLACLAPKEADGQVFNAACGRSYTLNELYGILQTLLSSDIKPVYSAPRPGDIRHSRADIGKAERLLGYKPLYDLDTGLRATIGWYRENL